MPIGTPKFHNDVQVRDLGNGVALQSLAHRGGTMMIANGRRVGPPAEGRVEIHAPRCTTLLIKCQGSGISRIHIPIVRLQVDIEGSLNLNCALVTSADVNIRGSGQVRLEEVTENCHVTVSGSGDVEIMSAIGARGLRHRFRNHPCWGRCATSEVGTDWQWIDICCTGNRAIIRGSTR